MSEMPDKIWANAPFQIIKQSKPRHIGEWSDAAFSYSTNHPDHAKAVLYLRSTPAREAAGELLEELKRAQEAYISLMEKGYERITDLGGNCDPVNVMVARDPAISRMVAAIAKATGGQG